MPFLPPNQQRQCTEGKCTEGKPLTFNVNLNHSAFQWANKLKCLGRYFAANNCTIDINVGIHFFLVTSIISWKLLVMGLVRWRLCTWFLIKAYCFSSALYGCEVWSLCSVECQKIFTCSWFKSVSPLLFLTLPAYYSEQDVRNGRASICLSHRLKAAAACGGFAAERRAGTRYRSTAFSSKSGQCCVDSWGMRLNTDLYCEALPVLYLIDQSYFILESMTVSDNTPVRFFS